MSDDRLRAIEQRVGRLEGDTLRANEPPPYDAVKYWTCEGCGLSRLASVHANGEVVIMAGKSRIVAVGRVKVSCYKCGKENCIQGADEGERYIAGVREAGVPVVVKRTSR